MLNSLTGAILRGLAVSTIFVLVPLSAAAQDPLTCRAWTDNPIVSGSTPLRAEHINELRACLDRIIQHLSVTPVDPVGGITVSEVLRIDEGSYSDIYATFVNNTNESVRFRTWVRMYDEDDQLLQVFEYASYHFVSVGAGATHRQRFFFYYHEWATVNSPAYWTLELTTGSGVPMLCSGCGRRPWW